MTKFHGSLDDLKRAVAGLNLNGDWSEQTGKHTFRAKTGEILNWFSSTGTLQFQGKNNAVFAANLNSALAGSSITDAASNALHSDTKIFVVHGHEHTTRDQLELVLRRLGLEPFILMNTSGGGMTIIEALERHIYQESGFGIVLLTPDDYGYEKTLSDADRKPRARQNVILEMGMLMASLGRDRIAILKKGVVEHPSDIEGILRLEFNDHVREIVPKLVEHMNKAGIPVDFGKIAAAQA